MKRIAALLFVLFASLPAAAQRYISVDIRWEKGFIFIPYDGIKARDGKRPEYHGQGNMKVVYLDREGKEIGNHFIKTPQFLETWDGENESEYEVRQGTFTVYLPYNLDIGKLAIYDDASWESKGRLIGDWAMSSRIDELRER